MTSDDRRERLRKRMERLRDQAAERGDAWEAAEMQKQIDEDEAAIRCSDCGAIVKLEVEPAGGGYVSYWTGFGGSTLHFTGNPGGPLMSEHRVEVA